MMLGGTRKSHFQLLLVVFVVVLLVCANTWVLGLNSSSGDAASNKCIERERHALLMIKKDLVDELDHLSSWGDEQGQKDCCNWRGITCDNRTGHVTMLDLGIRNFETGSSSEGSYYYEPLRGKISPSLLELQHLTYLDLSYNEFGGSNIPDFIGSLTKLRYLNLSCADFGGTIPYQLGNLSRLRSLDLSVMDSVVVDSPLTSENLSWLSSLSYLRNLDMSVVNLEKAVDWVQTIHMLPSLVDLRLYECSLPSTTNNPPPTNLSFLNSSISSSSSSLSVLDLSSNSLNSTIYQWLFDFAGSSLVHLNLSYNDLEGPIPDAFENMTSLAHLDLSCNQIEGGIPKLFGNFPSIRTLDLSENILNGNLPEIVRNLSGHALNTLEYLDLGSNQISGEVPDVTVFSSLRELQLSHNNLNGSLPSRFENPSKLEVMDMSYNQITGSFPDDVSAFSSLRRLHLHNNRINGSLPESIGELSNLEYLGVSSNQLRGTISESHFSNLAELKFLDLSNNHLILNFSSRWLPSFQLKKLRLGSCNLGPHFPVWLGTQENLFFLDISNASISDEIPSWFWGQHHHNLYYLNLSHNHIIGILPDLSSTFANVPTIDLSSNHLEGTLPIFPCNTTTLNLSNNKFTGMISIICATIGEHLSYLDLSNNELSGQLPDCWGQWEGLQALNLASNNFHGKIPISMGSLTSIQSLHLRNNSLIGELPSSLQNCTNLITMDVGENKLYGNVPKWIGEQLSRLKVFRLRSNEFYGIIPVQLCYLQSVQLFDIALNRITGSIPGCFNNFTAIAQNQPFDEAIIEYGWSFIPPMDVDMYTEDVDPMIIYPSSYYVDNALVAWKGRIFEYGITLGLVKSIDLSSNKLIGEIPLGLTNLSGLLSLNLSRNILVGSIPLKIGQLRSLESLDLSRNRLFGEIPGSISDLNFLNFLDLSYNQLSGKIPSGSQLQRLEASSFAGNPALYGPPLTQKCPGDYTCQRPPTTGGGGEDADTKKHEDKWFYASIALGFIVGFWGVCGTLVLHRSWRHAYFQLFDKSNDWLYVKKAVHTARFKRKLRAGLDRFH